jgi:predicted permease
MRKFLLKLRKRWHLDRDLEAEMQFHQENSDRNFGNATRVREDARELWTFTFTENLIRDLRLACRFLLKSPSFTVVCLLTLSLGIGINTAVFTLYDSLTYRLLPVRAAEELVRVVTQSDGILQPTRMSDPEFENLRAGLAGLASVVATSPTQTFMGTRVPGSATGEGVKVQFATANYFEVLGINLAPAQSGNESNQAGAVLSHTFWVRRLKADAAVVGRVIRLAGRSFTILGVTPEGFYGTDLPPHMPDVWLPLEAQPQVLPGADWVHDQKANVLQVVARRMPGTTLHQVSEALLRIGGVRISKDGSKSWLAPTPATAFQTNLGSFRGTAIIAFVLMSAVAVVLLIGCVNLVNLTLSRNAARGREIAVRLAMGASRLRIVEQLCAESLILGVASGVIGLGFSVLLCHWIRISVLAALQGISRELFGGFHLDLTPDWRVFIYTVTLSIVTAILVGVWPAFRSVETALHSGLKEGGLPKRQRRILLTAQISASFMLLATAGLLFRGTWQSRSSDPGFRVDNILLMSADLTMIDDASVDRKVILHRVLEHIRSIPEIASIALVDRPLFLGTGSSEIENEAGKPARCRFNRVSADYFDTLNLPLVAGRSFSQTEADDGTAEIVVSEALAKFYWPGESPLHRRITIGQQFRRGFADSSYTVVGVAKGVRNTFLSKDDKYYIYFPKAISDAGGWVLLRTKHSPDDAASEVRSALLAINPALAAHTYLISLASGPVQIQKLMTDVPGIVSLLLGSLALILSSVGVYGLVTYIVAQSIPVIGIHIALGARHPDLIRLVLGESLHCVAQGAVIGLLGAGCLSALLAALVKAPDLPDLTYQAGVFDPVTLLAALSALAFAVTAACLLPVYRATRIEPMTALRNN